MSQLVTQELAIVVAVQNQNPHLFAEDFLKQTGIVPSEWNLAQEPVYTERVVQITFENGLRLIAEPSRVMFIERMGDKPLDLLQAGTVARTYVETLKMADYQAVGINFRSHVAYDRPAAAADYIKSLLAPGGWLAYANGRVRPKLSFNYDLTNRLLSVSIDEAALEVDDRQSIPVVVFSGNFNYNISQQSAVPKSIAIANIIGNWQQEFDEYHGLINEQFLGRKGEIGSENAIEVMAIETSDRTAVIDAPVVPALVFN